MEAHAMAAGGLEQAVGALDVGADEGGGVGDGVVVVGLGGEMDDGVGARDEAVDELRIADVAHHELGSGIGEVLAAPRVGERIEHGHAHAGLLALQPMHERRPDEAGTACDQQVHSASPS